MRRALALLALGGLAACGTTVGPSAQVTPGGALEGGSAVQQPQVPGAGETAPATGSAQMPVGRGPKSAEGRAGTVPSQAAPVGGARVMTWPGLTATTISVGYAYVDTAAANAAVNSTGANGSKAGDIKAEHDAVANWINKHGGIAGRQIRLVPYKADINKSVSQIAQEACSAFTEDTKVYAAMDAYASAGFENLVACLAQHRTLALGSAYDVGDADAFAKYRPYYYAPSSLEMVTAGGAYAEGLGRQGFFGKGAKVGILVYDSPEMHHAMDRAVLPALRRYGITSPEVSWIAVPRGLSDEGNLVAATQNAELKFRSSGVTHVMFLDGNSSLTFFFIKQAQSQGWKPHYGFSTLSYPSFLELNFGADQLSGSVGVGWMPTEDVSIPKLPANPARSLCQQIQDAAGNRAVAETDLTIQLSICAQLFLLKHGLEHATGVSPADFLQGVARLGRTTDTAAGGLFDSYRADKPWGGSQVRNLRYVDACACFQYHGHPLEVS